MAELYYREEDHLTGILSHKDFVVRNPSRSLVDIQRWGELRKKWFEDNGYAAPRSENARGSDTGVNDKAHHQSKLDALDTLRGADGVFRGLENMEGRGL